MKILVIGSGGREHALTWKLSKSPKAEALYVLPGNPGCEEIAEKVDIAQGNQEEILRFCLEKGIDLAVIGPEQPLVDGLADVLTKAGIAVFGPSAAAARIEGSKSFSKDLMAKYGIPTARYKVFTDCDAAKAFVKELGLPIVIKADGLAAGKGVIIPNTMEEAMEALTSIMEDERFGKAGSSVVIEEFMKGEEVSVLAFTDGKTVIPMISSQDHKRVFDGDQGPNTGGMGTYAPAPLMNEILADRIQKEILEPVIAAMQKENCPFKGCLYAGLMVDDNKPKVVEFNARFGDPETQVVLPLLASDLAEIMLACAKGNLAAQEIKWSDESAVCVVICAGGYPNKYNSGDEITGIEDVIKAGCQVFQAGTKKEQGKTVTAGGRVLGVVAKGDTLESAIAKVYENIDKIKFKGAFYRRDIGHKGLARLKNHE